MSDKLQQEFAAKKMFLKKLIKQHPVLAMSVVGFVIIFFLFFSGNEDIQPHELVNDTVPFEKKEEHMTGVKESIDPRDVWTAQIERKIETSKEDFHKKLENINETKELETTKMQEEIEELKAQLSKHKEIMEKRELEDALHKSNSVQLNQVSKTTHKSLGLFTKEYAAKKKNIKNYVTSGSFARAVLMTGVVVGTGSNSQSNPEPVMMRLTDAGIFSKGKRTEQIKEAILIGDCSGDLSSERAKCRLQTLSIENHKGEIVERAIQGWIVGEDGRNGVKGRVVDKSSDILRMAMLNGVLGGMSSFLQGQATKGIFPISPISGQNNALGDMDQIKGGISSGAGDAFSKMADFIMERFNSMSPQIVIASGREVDVVFQNGVDLNGELTLESIQASAGNLGVSYNNPPEPMTAQAASFQRTMDQVNKGMRSEEVRNGF